MASPLSSSPSRIAASALAAISRAVEPEMVAHRRWDLYDCSRSAMSLYYNKTGSIGDTESTADEGQPSGTARSARSRVRRRAGRARYEREAVDAILDQGLVGHVAFALDGQPFAIPMLYARQGDLLYLHGSPLSRLVGEVADGIKVCLTVTLIDGLVLARSAFHHSVNYRSAVVFGSGRPIRDQDRKREALRVLVERMVPGRSAEVRGPSDGELDATEVVALEIDEASAKVRSGPPSDSASDYAVRAWAGELPLHLAAGEPVPDERCSMPVPAYLNNYARARD
jgi:uncharacterized protein